MILGMRQGIIWGLIDYNIYIGLVSRLIQQSGGTLEEKNYVRLSKLHVINSLFNLSNLRPGDCIIDFSSQKLYKLRQQINESVSPTSTQNKTKTAIIYGKMPPSCRKDQANKFNSGELPYLVASDAIGMGLNLRIKRIVFNNIWKVSNQGSMKILEDHQIRQIAGRAGRGEGHGYVQCTTVQIREKVKYALRNVNITIDQNIELQQEYSDPKQPLQAYPSLSPPPPISPTPFPSPHLLPTPQNPPYTDVLLSRILSQDQQKIKQAGIFFPPLVVQRIKLKMERIFKRKFRVSETILLIKQLSKQNLDLFFIQRNQEMIWLLDQFEELGLPYHVHCLFANIPLPKPSTKFKQILLNFARQYTQTGHVTLPSQLLQNHLTNFQKYKHIHQIPQLQTQYLMAEAYTWLWNHLELYFPYNVLCGQIKEEICGKMNQILEQARDGKEGEQREKEKEKEGGQRGFGRLEEALREARKGMKLKAE